MSADYQRGLDDAWEAAKKFVYGSGEENRKQFGTYKYGDFFDMTASEAVQKMKDYEVKNAIKVGDEVVSTPAISLCPLYNEPWIVTRLGEEYAYGFGKKIEHMQFIKRLIKTGRHFSEVEQFLKDCNQEDER